MEKESDRKLNKIKEVLKNNQNKSLVENILKNLSENKSSIDSLHNIISDIDLNLSGKSQKNRQDILDEIKIEEPINQEYYTYVKDQKDFQKRKIILDNSDEILKSHIDPLAEKFDKEKKLSYILRNKARFIMGMTKKYDNKNKKGNKVNDKDKDDNDNDNDNDNSNRKTEEEYIYEQEYLEEEITLNTGVDDNMIGAFKQKIKEEKLKKGRGLLIPFNQENEEKKIPKLIKAMKLGLRVVLISDSGTPTISDPGYRLIKEAANNGIVIEPLPGPSAVITALSASALPSDRFMFYGYLPKSGSDKIERIEEIKQIGVTSIIFESPLRLQNTLRLLSDIYGDQHEIYIGFELTKRFENHFHGKIYDVKKQIIKSFCEKSESHKYNNLTEEQEREIFVNEELNIKGEITLIIGPDKKSREEILEEKSIREKIDLDVIEMTRRLDKYLDLNEKQIRDILIKVCDVSKANATKVINKVKGRNSNISKTLDLINSDKLKMPDSLKAKKDFLEKDRSKSPSFKNLNKHNN
jgi:16S rRNA (cytidine1402-2'-O)-methyltransferase